MLHRRRAFAAVFALPLLLAALPPDRVHYQGILRDAGGTPLSGTYDMTFRFWSAATGGDEIFVDRHHAVNLLQVTVTGGLFDVALGDGAREDGAGPGTYYYLSEVVRDHAEVWLEIQVGTETLSPRTRLESTPYAFNSAHVGGIGADQLLRSDVDSTLAPGAKLTTGPATQLIVNGALVMNADGPDANQWISFYDDGYAGNEAFGWNDALDRFEVSNDFGADTVHARTFRFNGPDGDQSLSFFEDGVEGSESLTWEDSADRFSFSDALRITGTINVIGVFPPSQYPFNVFANGTPASDSGDMSNSGDVYVQADLEIDETLYVNGEIFMDDDGPDGSQWIRFYDGGSPSGQSLGWDEARNRFQASADLGVEGNLVFEDANDFVRFLRNAYDMVFDKDVDNDSGDAWFRFFTDGSTIEQLRITDGDEAATLFDGPATANGIDYAEAFGVDDPSLEPGDVVRLVPGRPDLCRKSALARDPNLLGVVSTRPGFVTGLSFEAEAQADPELAARREVARNARNAADEKRLTVALREKLIQTTRPVALLGRVPVKVAGAVAAGDRLTSSDVPGHAAPLNGAGPSIGVALEGWTGPGPGIVLAYVQPGWVGAEAFESPGPPATSAEPEILDSPGTSLGARAGFAQRHAVREGGLSQEFPVAGPVEPGEVVVADPEGGAALLRGTEREDAGVVGIVVSTAGVMTSTSTDGERLSGTGRAAVAMSGVVPCRVDASSGAVRVGDLLVSSETPGHAMRANDPPPGTVLGKALEPLPGGRGTIRVLVMAR